MLNLQSWHSQILRPYLDAKYYFVVLEKKNTTVLYNTLSSENYKEFRFKRRCSFEDNTIAKTINFFASTHSSPFSLYKL